MVDLEKFEYYLTMTTCTNERFVVVPTYLHEIG